MNDFKTKDNGTRHEFETGMQREIQSGKPRFDLIIPEGIPYDELVLTRWAKLMERGVQKYSARNWEKACTKEELDRFKSSAFRHFIQWFADEMDEDHMAAILFNIQGAEFVKYKLQNKGEKNGKGI